MTLLAVLAANCATSGYSPVVTSGFGVVVSF